MSRDLFETDALPDDVLEHLDDPDIRARWPETLASMVDVAAHALMRELGDAGHARRLATAVIYALAKYHGGATFYLPKGDELDCAIRDKKMWDRYDGRRESVLALAKEYRLTEQAVYRILARQRAIHRRRTQPDLPLDN